MKSIFSDEEVSLLLYVGKKYKLSGEKITLKSYISSTKPTPNGRLYSESAINSIIKETRTRIHKGLLHLSTFSTVKSLELGFPRDEIDDLLGKVISINKKGDFLEYTVELFEEGKDKIQFYKKPRIEHSVEGWQRPKYVKERTKEVAEVCVVAKAAPVVAVHSSEWFEGTY